jgi:hypothetical protein
MRKTLVAALAVSSLLAIGSCRQTTVSANQSTNQAAAAPSAGAGSPIDGTWKTDISTLKFNRPPDRFLLQGGKFSCLTCMPPLTIAADGAFHAVDRPYADHIAVKVDDAHRVTRIHQKNGRTTATVKFLASDDGNTLTVSFVDSSTPGAKPVTGSYTETRVAPAPAGAHAISGSWKHGNYSNMSDEALTATFREEGGILHFSSASGQSYDAKLDGSDTPVKGDIGGTTAAVKKISDNVYQETDKRGGKVIGTMTMTITPDGKMEVKDQSGEGSTTTYVATRQQGGHSR